MKAPCCAAVLVSMAGRTAVAYVSSEPPALVRVPLAQWHRGVSDNARTAMPLRSTPDDNDSDQTASGSAPADGGEGDEPMMKSTSVKIDDGGSDLTDRFKYKVHALMGDYDPVAGQVDDENQEGNILSALVNFPARHAFNVVGKTEGDGELQATYVEEVKAIVGGSTGDEENLEARVTPRGTKYTRISVEVTVESAAMISSIHEELKDMDRTVMSY